MKIKIGISLLLPFLWILLTSAGIKFSHITIEDGLSQSSIKCMFQDSKGFLWFGTADGLNKYDGFEFTIYRNNPTLPSSLSGNDISCIYENPFNNVLWIGTQGDGINLYSKDQDKFYSFSNEPGNSSSLVGNNVREIHVDESNRLWIATLDGGMCYFSPTDSSFVRPEFQKQLRFKWVNCFKIDNAGNFWIGTNNGLYKWNHLAQQNNSIPEKVRLANDEVNRNISSIEIDQKGNVWVGTRGQGLYKFHPSSMEIVQYAFSNHDNTNESNQIRDILKRKNGDIWIGTMNGLFKYNSSQNDFESFWHTPSNDESLNNDVIYSLLEDQARIIWIGTYRGGINKIDPMESRFPKHKGFFGIGTHPGFNDVRAVTEDENGTVWLSTTKGLLRIDKKYFTENNKEQYIQTYFTEDRPSKVFFDQGHSIWLNTQRGIYLKKGDGDFSSVNEEVYEQTGVRITSFNNALIDSDGKIWLTTARGFLKYDPGSDEYRDIAYVDLQEKQININPLCIIENNNGQILLGTFNGEMYEFDRHTERMKLIIPFEEDKGVTAFSKIFSIYESSPNNLWIGTNLGLYNYNSSTKEIVRYLDTDGLANNVVYAVLGDSKGYIWCATNSGVSVYIPGKNTFRNYTHLDGLQSNEFNQGAYFKSKSGNFYLGGIGGLNIFTPEIILPNDYIPNVVITGLEIDNEKIHPSTHKSILQKQVGELEKLKLNYKQKNISFEYKALSYSQSEKNQYKYILEGYDDDWVEAGNRHTASYTNLSHGEYVFKVKASNNDNVWNEKPTTIEILISPPFWKTWWFKSAIILLLVLAVYMVFYLRLRSVKHQKNILEKKVEEKTKTLLEQKEQIESQNEELKHINEEIVRRNEKIKSKNQLLNEQHEQISNQRDSLLQMAEQVKDANQAKLRFFTSISHELRTPLTLIIGPLKELIAKKHDINKNELKRKFKIIYGNASKLLLIVNQLMEFRKVETDNMEISVAEFDLVRFVKQIAFLFNDLASQRKYNFSFKSQTKTLMVWADGEKMEKLVYNLLANAFKYTPEHGTINILVSSGNDNKLGEVATIAVEDNGEGIEKEKIPMIFERFYQLGHTQKSKNPGSGLGLALVKKYVELHHGTIEVESEIGKGSTFYASIPLGKEHFEGKVKFIDEASPEIDTELLMASIEEYSPLTIDITSFDENSKKPLVLIIEDDKNLRAYMKDILSSKYRIIEAEAAGEGFKLTNDKHPSLIVCDVMLPDYTGFELCKQVKGDFKTSHIPIVLLTALADQSSQMSGIKAGADMYITKPFDLQHLILSIESLIEGRKRLQRKFISGAIFNVEESINTSPDQEFLNNAIKCVEDNLKETSFNVEALCASLKLSQPQVYRKIKSYTDLNITEFIRNIRLKKAAQLIQTKNLRISEVAYETGFNDPNYFTKCFIKLYGMTPSEFSKMK